MQAPNQTFVEKSEMPLPFSERLKVLRHSLRLSQADMGARLAISKNYVWQLEAGTKEPGPRIANEVERMEQSPDARFPARPLRKLAADAHSLLGIHSLRDVEIALRYIPVLTWGEAGRVLVAFEEMPAQWADRIPTDVSDPQAVAVEVRGDSMEPYIREGDRVILLPSQDPRNGDIVVAKFVNDGIVVKLYHESDNGQTVHLGSYNPLYPPQTFDRSAFDRIVPVDSVVKKIRH